MLVISDTTPVISLLKIGRLDLLRKMYGEVIIPAAVYDELTVNDVFPDEAEAVKNCGFLRRENVKNELAVKILSSTMGLDKGESEALVLYEDLRADLLLVDERKARSVARKMGYTIVGTLGLLIEAKRLGHISVLRPLLEALMASNIRISQSLFNEIVKLDDDPEITYVRE